MMPLYQETLRRLPLELVLGSSQDGARSSLTDRPLHVPPLPTKQEFEEFERLVEHYLDAVHRFGSYVHDLRVEAQNFLLSDLYPDQRVPRRMPLDPSQKVVTVEHADELKAFFRNETPWGKDVQKTEEEVLRQNRANESE